MKTILITGGTGGLGSPVSHLLLKNSYRIIIPYESQEQADGLRRSVSPELVNNLTLIHADALTEKGVSDIYSTMDSYGNSFYGLVHLLGGIRPLKKVSETSIEDWDFIFSLNLRSFFLFTRAAMKRFEHTHDGRIISIGAMPVMKPSAKQSAYGSSKAGVVTLTKILADEGREIGVTANSIIPSVIRTKANLEWGSEEEAKKWVTPEEIAQMILFLLSDDARSINGSVIRMFGKMNV